MRQALRAVLVLGLAMLLTGAPVLAVGTLTVTGPVTVLGNIDRYTLDWVSAADGSVSGNAFTPRGYLLEIRFVPDAGGTQPTALYDITLVDSDGMDLLTIDGVSYGANLSNTAALRVVCNPPLILDGTTTLDLVVANAGNAKGGTVTLLVRRN
jgi:hypothetical protein